MLDSCGLFGELFMQACSIDPGNALSIKPEASNMGILHVGGTAKHMCFGTISASKEKDPPTIWAHLSLILDEVKASYPSAEMVHFFSDGPCTQYRQKGNFLLFSMELMNHGFKRGTWNFFEACHGKGAPDGVGGFLIHRLTCSLAFSKTSLQQFGQQRNCECVLHPGGSYGRSYKKCAK